MQRTKTGLFFDNARLRGGVRVNYTSGYFERGEKRSPYSAGGASGRANGRRGKTSIGFTLCAVLLLFIVYPVGLIMIWNKRVDFTPGTKLLLTLLAAVVFCLILVYIANLDTGNPQLRKVQNALNKAFDKIYEVFASVFNKLGEWLGFKDGRLNSVFGDIWDGIKYNYAKACIKLLGDKSENAAYLKTELPRKLFSAYKQSIGYEDGANKTEPVEKSNIVARYTPEPTATATPSPSATPNPTPAATAKTVKVTLPKIRSASEAAVYYNQGGTYYHVASTCKDMFSADSHTLKEAKRDGKIACQNCSVVSLDILDRTEKDYLWVDIKNVAHTTDLCLEFTGAYRIIPFKDVYEGHYTYCPKCGGEQCYEYMRQNDSNYNVQYENLSGEEVLLYEYEKTIEVYYGTNSRNYHSTRDCQQMYDDSYVHNLFEALHRDGKKPCAVCNPYNEADAREYLEQAKQQ